MRLDVLTPRDDSMADRSYELIMDQIHTFEEGLDSDHELGLMLASFGQGMTLHVTDVGFANPSTLFFYGDVDYGDGVSSPATLVQHMSQLNFLMVAVPKPDPAKPPFRVGFALPSED